jgi:hypothetical protein
MELPGLMPQAKFVHHSLGALSMAAMAYSILRAGVRFFGYALPGSCTNAWLNLSLAAGTCDPASTWLITRMSWATSAHAWSWVMYGTFGLIVAAWPLGRYGFDGFRGFMLVGLGVATHELFWFFTYFVVHPILSEIVFNLEVYGSFIAMCAIGLVIFWLFGYQKEIDMRIFLIGLGVFSLFYAGWAAIGYPLTLDLKIGVTPLFASGWVDFIEFTSWLLMFAIIGFSYYAKQIQQRN